MYVVFTMSLSLRSGGLFTSVRKLSEEISNKYDVCVLSGEDGASDEELTAWCNLRTIVTQKYKPYSFGFMPLALFYLIRLKPTVIHCHGVWSYNALCTLIYKLLFPSTFIIISPRGMLDTWSLENKKLKKKIALFLYTRKLIVKADIIHALCENEQKQIVKNFEIQKSVIIPNGISTNSVRFMDSEITSEKTFVIGYIGRIHPKKGLENMIDALDLLRADDIIFNVAGFGDSKYISELKSRVSRLGLEKQVQFEGFVLGAQKEEFFKRCHCTILPSQSEGLPMSVLESWSHGRPTFLTKECNFEEVNNYEFAIRILPDPNDIRERLQAYMKLNTQHKQYIGLQAQDYVNQNYNWQKIGEIFLKSALNA